MTARERRAMRCSTAIIAVVLAACGAGPEAPARSSTRSVIPRPAACVDVISGSDVQAALDRAAEGDAICLAPGDHRGPLVLKRRLMLWGPSNAVVRSSEGSTVVVTGAGVQLLGFTVDGSGTRVDTLDSAIRVQADDVRVAGIRVEHATFGILTEKVKRATIEGCEVIGSHDEAIGLRGDAIRLWETNDSRVERNSVEGSRDLVVWYSSRNIVRGNEVRDGRYGTHFMFSHDNVVEDNRYFGNTVGIFVMYSRGLRIARNVLAGSIGSAGMGLGLKESGNLEIVDNLLVHNTSGVYVDSSPLQDGDRNVFARNDVRLAQAGVVFHGSEKANEFRANRFADNRVHVRVEGRADALGVTFDGNDYDDYAGYDLDGDGTGDLPYELRSLSGDLTGKNPELAFLSGTPALALVDAVGQAIPLFAPKVLLRDARPRTAAWEFHDAR